VRGLVVQLRGSVLLVAVAACSRGLSGSPAPRSLPADGAALAASAPTSSSPTLSDGPTPTCPGDRTGVVCDIFLTPTCGPGQHVRVIKCRPVCADDAACLVPAPAPDEARPR
jgi:hypothetical protein